jgi:hypothetical protein
VTEEVYESSAPKFGKSRKRIACSKIPDDFDNELE